MMPDARVIRGWSALAFVLVGALLLLVPTDRGEAATAYDPEERQFLDLINDYRRDNGLQPLGLSDTLTVASEHHSKDMARYGFFAHNTARSSYYPSGARPWDRMDAEGYDFNTAKGENLAVGYETAEEALRAWQESPSHDAAMLDADYRVVGIARINVPGSDYGWYWTTDFGGVVERAPRRAEPASDRDPSGPDGPAPDSGAVENGGLSVPGVWTQAARDGVDLVMDEGYARLGGYLVGEDELRQKVRLGRNSTLAYDVKVKAESENDRDRLVVRLTDRRGRSLGVLATYNAGDETRWRRERVDLERYAGRTVFLSFHAWTDGDGLTTFYVDDVSLDR